MRKLKNQLGIVRESFTLNYRGKGIRRQQAEALTMHRDGILVGTYKRKRLFMKKFLIDTRHLTEIDFAALSNLYREKDIIDYLRSNIIAFEIVKSDRRKLLLL